MEFPYIKVIDFPKHQKRERILPWIRFGIFNPKEESNILYPVGLIDSGSDITIIDYELGEKLGFEKKPIIYQDFVAFTYEKFPSTMPQQTAILGTIGFFRHVDVTLKYPKNIFVEPKTQGL